MGERVNVCGSCSSPGGAIATEVSRVLARAALQEAIFCLGRRWGLQLCPSRAYDSQTSILTAVVPAAAHWSIFLFVTPAVNVLRVLNTAALSGVPVVFDVAAG
jgi:hypothetical protein